MAFTTWCIPPSWDPISSHIWFFYLSTTTTTTKNPTTPLPVAHTTPPGHFNSQCSPQIILIPILRTFNNMAKVCCSFFSPPMPEVLFFFFFLPPWPPPSNESSPKGILAIPLCTTVTTIYTPSRCWYWLYSVRTKQLTMSNASILFSPLNSHFSSPTLSFTMHQHFSPYYPTKMYTPNPSLLIPMTTSFLFGLVCWFFLIFLVENKNNKPSHLSPSTIMTTT